MVLFQSLKLEIKKKFEQSSIRSLDLHPTEPWILASLSTWLLCKGTVCIWNYRSKEKVKTFEASESTVMSAKLIARKQWVVSGGDDMFISCLQLQHDGEVHADFITCVAVHPTLPYVLSSSDDFIIKHWNWDEDWVCTQTFKDHSLFVKQVTFNPKDTNTFASAYVDCTIEIWNLGSLEPISTLHGHLNGVTCVDYFTGGDKPYLITGSDDKIAKVWDYQTESCVQTLEDHKRSVSVVCFHPKLPIIITGSDDGIVRIWHATTYRV